MRSTPLLIALALCLASLPARAEDAGETIQRAQALAGQQQYEEALRLLETAARQHPGDGELTLARIRIHSWAGDYAAADALLSSLPPAQAANPDAQLLRANLAYYRGDYDSAINQYQEILRLHPGYTDASTGLENAQRAAASPENWRWQLDAGYEFSDFSRRPQADWHQQFLQVTHKLDNRATTLHGRVARYDQFGLIDGEYELGVDHRFHDGLFAYAYGTTTPEDDFRPEWRLAAGGAGRILQAPRPVWLTLDSRVEHYNTAWVVNINPGLRVEAFDGWSLSARMITVDQEDSQRAYGWDTRLDGTITDSWRFYLGYADSPETIAGVAIDTKSFFGGLSVDLTPSLLLRLGYAREDREASFIRHVVSSSVAYRF